jgi:hypothetical protein
MRRQRGLRGALGLVLAGAALLTAPAASMARGGFDLSFRFPASHGYEISVGGYEATAVMDATKVDPADGRKMWSTYIARGTLSSTAIDADFGAVGSASMRFRPSGKATYGKRHRGCVGPDRYTTQYGVFVGSVRFRGEGGYSSATVHRVKGTVVTPRRLACRNSSFQRSRGEGAGASAVKAAKVTRLESFLRSGLAAMYFSAARGHGQASFLAETQQTVGSLGVFRGVLVRASSSAFTADSALSRATVSPPPPFSGSASFQRAPTGAKSWVGPLTVSFPGAPDVSLTDPRLKTQLTRGW